MEYKDSSKDLGLDVTDPLTNAGYVLKKANFYYALNFLVAALLAFVLYNTGHTWIGKIINTIYTDPTNIGITLVERLSFALAVWFLLHAILTFNNKDLVASTQFMIHTTFKGLHTLVLVVLIGLTFVIPDYFFDYYLKASMFLSAGYLALQVFMLIIWFHDVNSWLAEKESSTVLLITTTVIGLGAVGCSCGSYYLFNTGSCTRNITVTTANLIVIVLLFVGSLLIEHGSILTSSIVSMYGTYLMMLGFFCNRECNRFSDTQSNIIFTVCASVITIFTIVVSAYNSSNKIGICDCGGDDDEDKPIFSLSFFHILYCFASVYLGMVVTHWGYSNVWLPWSAGRGMISMWVNFASSWFTYLIYGWTLLAPLILKDREFD